MINVSPTTTDRKSETEREKFSLFIFILILIDDSKTFKNLTIHHKSKTYFYLP